VVQRKAMRPKAIKQTKNEPLEAKGVNPVTIMSLDVLKDHSRNYRTHPDDELEHIIESIKAHGFYRPVVVARDLTILAGHGVVAAARKMKLASVPVVRLDLEPSSPRALKLLAGDNEIGHLAEIDDRALTEMLRQIKVEDVDGLLGTGFDEAMLANLLFVTRPSSEITDMNEAEQWAGMPEYGEEPGRFKLIVSFMNASDRSKFAKLIGIELGEKTLSIWWPAQQRGKMSEPSDRVFATK